MAKRPAAKSINVSATVQAYPNPFKDVVTIDLSGFNNEGGKDIIVSVYDITGKQVIAKSYTNNPSRIDLYEVEKLRSGSYFVKISAKDTTKILRIVGGSR